MRKWCARRRFFVSAELQKTPGFHGKKGEGDYFGRGEKCTECHMDRWFAGEIHMMHAANYSARGIEHDVEVNHSQGHRFIHHTEQHEDICNHDRGKQLEKIFNPQVDYPESPEIGGSEMRSRMRQQPHRIKGRDRKG